MNSPRPSSSDADRPQTHADEYEHGWLARLAGRLFGRRRQAPVPADLTNQVTVLGIQNARFWADSQGSALGQEAARALEVNPNVLHRWRREFRQGPGNVFPGNGKQRWSEGRIAELERKVGQQALEIDFLKGCLQRIEEQRMLQALTGNPRSTGRSKKK